VREAVFLSFFATAAALSRPHVPIRRRIPVQPSVPALFKIERTSSIITLCGNTAPQEDESDGVDGFMNWAFTYANLQPFTMDSLEAQLFLATNLGFFAVGYLLGTTGGNPVLGLMCELAGTASCWYHYQQVKLGGNRDRSVQIALAIDYACALPSLALSLGYGSDLGEALPASAVASTVVAFVCLAYGCRKDVMFEQPRVFMSIHGAWHLFLQLAGWQRVVAHSGLVMVA
jgi:hypothetical protein